MKTRKLLLFSIILTFTALFISCSKTDYSEYTGTYQEIESLSYHMSSSFTTGSEIEVIEELVAATAEELAATDRKLVLADDLTVSLTYNELPFMSFEGESVSLTGTWKLIKEDDKVYIEVTITSQSSVPVVKYEFIDDTLVAIFHSEYASIDGVNSKSVLKKVI